jgi:hypothetical protein
MDEDLLVMLGVLFNMWMDRSQERWRALLTLAGMPAQIGRMILSKRFHGELFGLFSILYASTSRISLSAS